MQSLSPHREAAAFANMILKDPESHQVGPRTGTVRFKDPGRVPVWVGWGAGEQWASSRRGGTMKTLIDSAPCRTNAIWQSSASARFTSEGMARVPVYADKLFRE